MKTIETIADEMASNFGYESIDFALKNASTSLVFHIMKMAATQYACQRCDEQIKACAKEAKAKFYIQDDIKFIEVDKDSILNTPNVVTTK